MPASVYVPTRAAILELLGKAEREIRLLGDFLSCPRRTIDVGANKGTYVVALAKISERVEAFEPQPACAELLRHYARQAARNVHVHECGLGENSGSAQLVVPVRKSAIFSKLATAYAKIDDDATGFRMSIKLRRLDDYLFRDVSFIKIDVEGFERAVLAGAVETISKCRPILLVEIEQRHLADGQVADVVNYVRDMNYDAKFLFEGTLRSYDSFDPDIHQRTSALNYKPGRPSEYVNNFLFFPRQ